MLTLKERKDNFRFLLPSNFIVEEINDKYARILQEQHSFIYKPIDFLNETIRSIQVLGFNEATFVQQQPGTGHNLRKMRTEQNKFMFSATERAYRGEVNPLQLLDKTFNVTFRHTLGFINYFMLFENFWYIYHRDTDSKDLSNNQFFIDFMDGYGRAYSRIVLEDPLINSIDMLSLDYTAPIASSETFNVAFKYSNIDYQFLEVNDEEVLKATV